MNTITFNLSDQDRELLNNILEALKSQPNCAQCAQISNAYAQELKDIHSVPEAVKAPYMPVPEELINEGPVEGLPAVAEEPEPVEEQEQEPVTHDDVLKLVTHDDVLKLVRELSKTRLFDDARDIVKSYAECVSDIPEDKLAEAYARLNELE